MQTGAVTQWYTLAVSKDAFFTLVIRMIWPSHPTAGYVCQRNENLSSQRKPCSMSIVAQSIIVKKNCEQPNAINRWRDKLCYSQTMAYSSLTTQNKQSVHTTNWLALHEVMLMNKKPISKGYMLCDSMYDILKRQKSQWWRIDEWLK